MRGSVYLAGPIRHVESYDEASDWRKYVDVCLAGMNIETYSPMRAKEYLQNNWHVVTQGNGTYPEHPLSTMAAITARDRFDVERADLILANFLGATDKASLGTAVEFGWADSFRVPIVMVVEERGNIHDHGMLKQLAGWHVTNLDDAIRVIDAIL